MSKLVVTLFAALALLAGCQADPTPTATEVRTTPPAPTPTSPPSPTPSATPTPTASPASTPTATAPAPTPTSRPTPTGTAPAPTATATPTPSPTPAATPTPTVEPCRVTHDTPVISGPSGPEGADNDSVFRSLTVHPLDPDTLIIGTERNGFVRSTDGGATWTRLRSGFRSDQGLYPEIWDIAISPSDPSVLMAATLDSPGPTTGDAPSVAAGIYKSTDGGESWSQMNCGFTTSRVNSVRFDPANPEIAVAGLEGGEPSYSQGEGYFGGGIFRTVDGGQSWTPVDVGPNDERNGYWVMHTVPAAPRTIVTFGISYRDLSENLGFLRSRDSGATWEPFGDALRHKQITSFALSSDGQVIYANEDGTYFGWVSRDGGESWSQSDLVQVNGPVAVSPVDPDLVIFGSQQELRRSTNALRTVRVVVTAPQPPGLSRPAPFQEIQFAPSDPSIVYAETEGYLVYRSDDAGATWRLMANVRDEVLNVQP